MTVMPSCSTTQDIAQELSGMSIGVSGPGGACVQLATLLNLVMSAILYLNALLCNICASDTSICLLMMMLR